MLKARNLSPMAKWDIVAHEIDLSVASTQTKAFTFPYKVAIKSIKLVYSVTTSVDAITEDVEVGISTDYDHYFGAAPSVSQAAGVVQNKTIDSADVLTAGTPLFIRKSAAGAGANTGEVTVVVEVEVVES